MQVNLSGRFPEVELLDWSIQTIAILLYFTKMPITDIVPIINSFPPIINAWQHDSTCFFFTVLLWTIFKVFIKSVTVLILFFQVLAFWPRGMWDLISLARDWSCSPCFGRRNLNYWAAREVPGSHTLKNLNGCSLPWGSPPITKATLGTDALLWNLLEQLGGAGLSSLLHSLTWLPPIHLGHWREYAFVSRTLLLAGSCGLSSLCSLLQSQKALGLCLSPFLLHQELQPHVHSKCCKGSIGSPRVSSASPCRGTEAGRFP